MIGLADGEDVWNKKELTATPKFMDLVNGLICYVTEVPSEARVLGEGVVFWNIKFEMPVRYTTEIK